MKCEYCLNDDHMRKLQNSEEILSLCYFIWQIWWGLPWYWTWSSTVRGIMAK